MDEALKLLHELNLHITTVNLDMGGNNRYALTAKAHPVISRIKLYLSDHPNKPVKPTANACNCISGSPQTTGGCPVHGFKY